MGRKIPLWQILLVLLVMIASLMYTIIVVEGYMHCVLILCAAFAAIIAIINGYKWDYLEKGILRNINASMQALLILLVVGMLIGTWIAGGIIQTMIYYGLQIINPKIFLIAACLLSAVVSLATGSSWTTAGTVGIALIGIGTALDINLGMTAGAIISGAYFGDKMSPLSDSTNLAPAMAGDTLFEHIRHMVYTVTPSLVIALIIYGVLGMRYGGKSADLSSVTDLMAGLKANFFISPILLVPPLMVILMIVFKLPAIPGLLGGSLMGVVCAVAFQGGSIGELVGITMYQGYTSETGIEFIDQLLTRGGLSSMFYSAVLVLSAMCLAGVLEASDMLNVLCEKLLKFAKSRGSLVLLTIATCIVINILCADQYVSIVLPGRMYKQEFEDRRLKRKNLSRILEDAGTMTSGLIPWTTCGAYMTTTLGVGPWGAGGYAKYAFLNLLNPLVSLFYGITGITMEKMSEEEYQQILHEREKAKEEELAAVQMNDGEAVHIIA